MESYYNRFSEIVELVGAESIVGNLVNYFSSNDLADFVEYLEAEYDLNRDDED